MTEMKMDRSSESGPVVSRGRPRNYSIDQAVLQVTQRNLAANGYHRMSVDTIAAEAGTTKATIYKRWSSKADLATAAVSAFIEQESSPDTGSTKGDLVAYLDIFRNRIEQSQGMGVVGALLTEERHNPELLGLFRERILLPRRLLIRRVLERAADRGELRENVDLDTAVGMLLGSYYAEYISGREIPHDWAKTTVGIIWSGISVECCSS